MKAKSSAIRHLRSTKAPWISILRAADWPAVRNVLSTYGDVRIFEVEGRNCQTKSALLSEFAGRLTFPDYFGRNWDAFDECIQDLEWVAASGYLVVIANADRLLEKDKDNYDVFLDSMRTAAKEWARRQTGESHGIPFHVILLVPDGDMVASKWKVPPLASIT